MKERQRMNQQLTTEKLIITGDSRTCSFCDEFAVSIARTESGFKYYCPEHHNEDDDRIERESK